MRDVAEVDTSSSVLGIPVKVPLFICPTGLAKMINPEGEKALARAAKSTGILEIVSIATVRYVEMLMDSAVHQRQSSS
jgi:L-lactate dehydrogenase (cytochrome)